MPRFRPVFAVAKSGNPPYCWEALRRHNPLHQANFDQPKNLTQQELRNIKGNVSTFHAIYFERSHWLADTACQRTVPNCRRNLARRIFDPPFGPVFQPSAQRISRLGRLPETRTDAFPELRVATCSATGSLSHPRPVVRTYAPSAAGKAVSSRSRQGSFALRAWLRAKFTLSAPPSSFPNPPEPSPGRAAGENITPPTDALANQQTRRTGPNPPAPPSARF